MSKYFQTELAVKLAVLGMYDGEKKVKLCLLTLTVFTPHSNIGV